MHRPLFGEFMGTMVLILAGRWCRCQRPPQEVQRRGLRLDRHHHRMGIGRHGGHLYRYRLRQPGSAHQPCGHASSGPVVAQLGQRTSVLGCAVCRRLCRRHPGVVGLSAALEQ